jgi:hypothetical protein
MAFLADRLLSGLKRRIVQPSSQQLLSNSDILEMADDTIKTKLVTLIKSVNQDFFVTNVQTSLVASQKYYAIPYRALGRTLRDLKLVDSSGNRRDLSLIAIEDEHMYRSGTIAEGFYFFGDKVAIVPTPTDATYSLEFWYELPPNRLCISSDAGEIASFTTTTVTVTSAPTTIAVNSLVDFIAGKSGCQTLAFDSSVTNVASTTYTLASSAIPSGLAVGDFIAPAGKSPVIQLPDESYPYLETCLAMRVLKTIGDFDGAKLLESDKDEEEKALKMILAPRISGETTKIINRRGILRATRGRFLSGSYL